VYAILDLAKDTNDKWKNYFLRRFDELADQTNSSFCFAVGDMNQSPDLSRPFIDPITSEIDLPVVALQSKGKMYKFEGEFSTDNLKQWLEKWGNGLLKPYIRTGGLVNNVPGTLYTLTTENLEPVVNDWTKDVLVIFYGPKCPYSKEFLDNEVPKLLEMVNHVSSLVIAKINCAENECSPGYVKGFPTIGLYKGCKKGQKKPVAPIGYWEIREADDLFRWLKLNSYYSIPKKPLPHPKSDLSKDPVIAEAEQVGGKIDALPTTNMVM